MLVAGFLGFGALAAALLAYFWRTRRNLFAGIFAGALALSLIRL